MKVPLAKSIVAWQRRHMVPFKAHFNGAVLVPDEPVDLPMNQALRVVIQAVERGPETTFLDLAHSEEQAREEREVAKR